MDDFNYPAETEAKQSGMGGALQARRLDITLRQNIDEKIKQAEATVALLKATKDPHGEVRHPRRADRRRAEGDALEALAKLLHDELRPTR